MPESKIACVACGKSITKSNMAAHKKRCKIISQEKNPLTYDELKNELTAYKEKFNEQEIKNKIQHYEIENLKLQLENLKYQLKNKDDKNIINNNVNITNINNFYVFDSNGLRDGLDMHKLRHFGDENVDYVDKDAALWSIMNDIYFNDKHLENKTISFIYKNGQWIAFNMKEHILKLNLEFDNEKLYVMRDLLISNLSKLIGRKFENYHENEDATKLFLNKMINEMDSCIEKYGNDNVKMPIWNEFMYKERIQIEWKKYMNLPNYSGINTKSWDLKGY